VKRPRVESVDLLRGIVMVLMALDHVRDFFGDYAANPTDLATTTAPLFFTRWITHFCAPVFFLLAGVGAQRSLAKRSSAELTRFLLTRGLWLVFLDAVVLRWAIQFNFDYKVTVLNVLWALGWSMVLLALLVRLPMKAILITALVMVAGHNLLDGIPASSFGVLAPLWNFLHAPGLLLAGPERFVALAYPIIPWVGVMMLGFTLGQVYDWSPERRRRFLLRLGLGLTAGFLVLRGVNVYGDPFPWSAQVSPGRTLLSFLNTMKYPPSLAFLLMTLGPALWVLALLETGTPRLLRPALTFGRVPLFYFLVHFAWIHLLAVGLCYARYGSVHWMFESPSLDRFPFTQPPDWSLGLLGVYLMWIVVLATVYPVCVWFESLKRRRQEWWLGYL
jgi:uncharacterized membrane protein